MNKVAIAVIAVVVICVGIGAAVMIGNNSNDSEITEGVIYHGNGGTNDGKTTFSVTEHKVMQSLFTWDGYKFVSWNTSSDGKGTEYNEGDTIDFKSGQVVNLYATWKVIGHSITLSSWGNLSFYYDDEAIGFFGLDIPDSGTITVKIKAPEGAKNVEYKLTTLSSGSNCNTVQYDLEKDGSTVHYTHIMYAHRGDESYTPTFATVSDGVEMTIECNNTDISISYGSMSKA